MMAAAVQERLTLQYYDVSRRSLCIHASCASCEKKENSVVWEFQIWLKNWNKNKTRSKKWTKIFFRSDEKSRNSRFQVRKESRNTSTGEKWNRAERNRTLRKSRFCSLFNISSNINGFHVRAISNNNSNNINNNNSGVKAWTSLTESGESEKVAKNRILWNRFSGSEARPIPSGSRRPTNSSSSGSGSTMTSGPTHPRRSRSNPETGPDSSMPSDGSWWSGSEFHQTLSKFRGRWWRRRRRRRQCRCCRRRRWGRRSVPFERWRRRRRSSRSTWWQRRRRAALTNATTS